MDEFYFASYGSAGVFSFFAQREVGARAEVMYGEFLSTRWRGSERCGGDISRECRCVGILRCFDGIQCSVKVRVDVNIVKFCDRVSCK